MYLTNNAVDITNRILGLCSQSTDFGCYNGKSFTGFSCTGSFYACVKSQHTGAVGNTGNGFDDSVHLSCILTQSIHLCDHLLVCFHGFVNLVG